MQQLQDLGQAKICASSSTEIVLFVSQAIFETACAFGKVQTSLPGLTKWSWTHTWHVITGTFRSAQHAALSSWSMLL